MKKKIGPRMEPCGTPALTGNHSDVWSLSSTLWNLILKELWRCNRESETPTDLGLNISPLCQTLSKALDISRNTPQVSRVGSALCNLCTNNKSWFTHKSLDWKPHWWNDNSLLSSGYLYKELKINLSNIFPQTGNNDTGQYLLIACLSAFLWIGHIIDFFQISGSILWLIQLLKMIVSGSTIVESPILNILMEILSWPWALLTSNDLIILLISLLSNLTDDSLVFRGVT